MERFVLSDLQVYEEVIPKFNPSKKFVKLKGFKCPVCLTLLPPAKHCQKDVCHGCGTDYEAKGNALFIW